MSVESIELTLFANNDDGLYNQRIVPVVKSLAKKYAAGKYDHEKAIKLWRYVADDAAKRYAKEFGGVWNTMFTVADRNETARQLADDWMDDVKSFASKDSVDTLFPDNKAAPMGDPVYHAQSLAPGGEWITRAFFPSYDDAVFYVQSASKGSRYKWRVIVM